MLNFEGTISIDEHYRLLGCLKGPGWPFVLEERAAKCTF